MITERELTAADLTDDLVEALCTAASEHDDEDMVALCDLYITGDPSPGQVQDIVDALNTCWRMAD